MFEVQNYFIALFRATSFDLCVNGTGHFFLTKDDVARFPVLTPFTVVFVRALGQGGYAVEVA